MSEELTTAPRPQYKQRLSTFVQSRRGKMFGVAEAAALAASCFVLLLVLLSYLYFLVPTRSNVSSLSEDKTRLHTNLRTLQGVVNKEENTKQQVDKVAASLNEFETTHLLRADQGRLDFYDELNQIIVKNNLRNTSGPAYTPLDPLGAAKAASGKSITTKWQSFYPGIAVMVTVEGQYQDIRRFVRDIERSKQFVVINQVELQRANENSSADEAASGTKGSLISLQLNLAAYFQRDNAANTESQPQENRNASN